MNITVCISRSLLKNPSSKLCNIKNLLKSNFIKIVKIDSTYLHKNTFQKEIILKPQLNFILQHTLTEAQAYAWTHALTWLRASTGTVTGAHTQT